MADPRINNNGSRDIGRFLDKADVIDALKRSDASIAEILSKLPANISIRDIQNWLRDQERELRGSVIQENPVYASSGEMPPPRPEFFQDHQSDQDMDEEDQQLLARALLMGAKAQLTNKADPAAQNGAANGEAGEGDAQAIQSYDELVATAEGTVGQLEQFMSDVMGDIIDRQMAADMQRKLDEVKGEVAKILSMVKSGALSPEYAIIALMKVHQTRCGALMVWKGKQLEHVNAEQNRLTAELPASPGFADAQILSNKTREAGMSMQRLTSDMQQITTSVATSLDHGKSMIDDIKRMREQMIQKMNT